MHDMPLKTKFVILASAFHTVIASGEIRDERKFRIFPYFPYNSASHNVQPYLITIVKGNYPKM